MSGIEQRSLSKWDDETPNCSECGSAAESYRSPSLVWLCENSDCSNYTVQRGRSVDTDTDQEGDAE